MRFNATLLEFMHVLEAAGCHSMKCPGSISDAKLRSVCLVDSHNCRASRFYFCPSVNKMTQTLAARSGNPSGDLL